MPSIDEALLLDANLLLLLLIGSADRRFIVSHGNLGDYDENDFDLLSAVISGFSFLVVVPHVLTEVSNLSRQVGNPMRSMIQEKFRFLITASTELPVQSAIGAQREEFIRLGLTDSVLLDVCSTQTNDFRCTLLSTDESLVNQALALGYSAVYFWELS